MITYVHSACRQAYTMIECFGYYFLQRTQFYAVLARRTEMGNRPVLVKVS